MMGKYREEEEKKIYADGPTTSNFLYPNADNKGIRLDVK